MKQFLQVHAQIRKQQHSQIQKISFAQFCPADVGFWGFAQPGFNRGFNHG